MVASSPNDPVADFCAALVDAWSCHRYEIWLSCLGRLVDATVPSPEMFTTFDRAARFELLFLDGLHNCTGW